ncbi:OmpH family outer membrane protein [Piscirickettsia litoralis]|uniref:Outer membrane family protein n=1 Tax=Piscirickettsia litoralis TaxID=1891921 RepID=A0ABX3A224_9GAMM|nr:outer membrane family protein [Piscirickettsia litoralis]ODN42919.1 outer membrane family protein [Piscirickettsia litoralis]
MKLRVLVALCLATFGLQAVEAAQVAVVDLVKVNKESPLIVAKNDKLAAAEKEKSAKLLKMRNALIDLSAQEKKEIAAITDANKRAEAVKTAQLKLTLEEEKLKKEALELQKAQLEEQHQAQVSINKILDTALAKLAKNKKEPFDLLVNKQAVLYSDGKVPDLTPQLISALQKEPAK